MFEEYRDRVGELITGIVQQSDSRYTLVQLRERVEALLPKSEQVDGERYDHSPAHQGRHQGGLALHEGPVDHRLAPRPRADQEAVRARGARDRRRPGRDRRTSPASPATARRSRSSRTPTASTRSAPASARAARACAWSSPSCAARRSTSSPTTTSPPASSPRRCRPRACARCSSTTTAKQATVIVPDDQLSLAIGREGQNARLAARLTGWRVDIRSETEFAAGGGRARLRGGGASPGRCAAILSNGRRCPNAALPGSRYCGLPAHQALEPAPTTATTVGRATSRRPARAQPPRPSEPRGEPPTARARAEARAPPRRAEPTPTRADASEPRRSTAESPLPSATRAGPAAPTAARPRRPARRRRPRAPTRRARRSARGRPRAGGRSRRAS